MSLPSQNALNEKELLLAVLDQPTGERDEYLTRACRGDSHLKVRIQELLQNALDGSSFMAKPAVPSAVTELVSAVVNDRQIGRYKLMEKVGEGGMGSVYVAEQTEPVRRKVALKIIKPGMDSRQVILRFEAERQALALMDHPNIAKILDAGTTKLGRPYFVMELVKGIAITDHCTIQKLALRGRLELFLQVCRAVEHAHQKGIIHRDLKPSNVMVSMHDTTPTVKVIDFGVAKAIGHQLTDGTLYTGINQMVGTLQYMSPEQAGQSGLDVDTRSDVYSLGVLFYELLTGTTPMSMDTLRQVGYDEMRRIICEVDPPRPSARVSTLVAGALSTLADQLQTAPPKLSLQLRGELDSITVKALEKDRNRRYDSAGAFAADVERYLRGEAVHACPPTWKYRFGKFVQRNKTIVATSSLVACAIIVGSIVSILQAIRATEFERVANAGLRSERQARLAEREARKDTEHANLLAKRNAADAYRQQYKAEIQLGRVDLDSGNMARLYQTLAGHLPKLGRADLRGWEWYYLSSCCQGGRTLYEHYSNVSSLDCSPDGKYLATTSYDGQAIVWDAHTGRRVRCFSFGDTLKRGIAWSPDSQRLAWGSVGDENAVRIWDRRSDEIRILYGHTHSLLACAWSPDGSRLATTSMDKTAKIWDTSNWKCLHTLDAHRTHVYAACWMQDGQSLITVEDSSNGEIIVWNADSGKPIHRIPSEQSYVSAAIGSADPQKVFVGSSNGECHVFDTGSWKMIHKIAGHTSRVRSVATSQDGKRFASGGQDGKILVWDSASGEKLFVLRSTQFDVSSLAWNPNGQTLVSGCSNGTVKQWDLPLVEQLVQSKLTSEPINSFQWSESDRVLKVRERTGTQTSWDLLTKKTAQTHTASSPYGEALSPDGKLDAVKERSGTDKGIKIIVSDCTSRQILCELDFPCHTLDPQVPPLVWSPDSRRLVTHDLKTLALWEIPSGKRLFDWDGPAISSIDWSSQPADQDQHRLRQDGPAISSIDWSSDCRRFAMAGGGDLIEDGTTGYMSHLHIFDVEQKSRLLKKRTSSQRVLATTVAWSLNDERIASGNESGEIEVWEVATGTRILHIRPHVASITSLAWSPDGSRIASASREGSLKIFDAVTGDEYLPLLTGGQTLTSVGWSFGGTKLAASDSAGQVYVWTASLANNTKNRTTEQRRSLADMHAALGAQHKEQGDLESAVAELSNAIELTPSHTHFRRSRAACYSQQGLFEQALNDLSFALDLDPEDSILLRARGDLLADMGRWEEAQSDYSSLVELTQASRYSDLLAVIQLKLGNTQAYREICRRPLSNDGIGSAYGSQHRAWTCSVIPGNIDALENILVLALKEIQQETDVEQAKLGGPLYRVGRIEEAVEALMVASRNWDRTGSIEPAGARDHLPGYTWYFLAMANHDLGRYAESRNWYDRAKAYSDSILVNKPGTLHWHQRAVLELLESEARSHIGGDRASTSR